MSNTTSDLASSATNATASPSSTDATYDFSIKEATIRNTAIGVCLALFVFLVCALIGLEIMRRRLKRMRKQLLGYMRQEEEGGRDISYRGQDIKMSSSSSSSPVSNIRYHGPGSVKMSSSPVSSEDIRYQLVSPPERSLHTTSEVSVQGEVFESDARSLHSFHRGETRKLNKNVVNKWYDLRGHVGRDA